jgi:hypothetical protein
MTFSATIDLDLERDTKSAFRAYPMPMVLEFYSDLLGNFYYTRPTIFADTLKDRYEDLLRLVKNGKLLQKDIKLYWCTDCGYSSVFGDSHL